MIDDHHMINIDQNTNSNIGQANLVSPETNLCGYDSFLHATICSNANINLQNQTSTSLNVTPHRITGQNHHSHHHSKKQIKTKNNQIPPNRLNTSNIPFKQSTVIQNQLNPNLTSEQKLSRTINYVEKWLTDRDHQILNKNHRTKSKLIRSKSKEEIPIKEKTILKIVEDEKTIIPPQLNKKLPTSKYQKNNHQSSTKSSPEHSNKTKQGLIMEYASIPVNADPSECENLLRGSDEDTTNGASTTPSTVHRYVHEHIHHHYHHFENDEA